MNFLTQLREAAQHCELRKINISLNPDVVIQLLDGLQKAEAERDRLKLALQFYANEMIHPLGNVAREALAGSGE